MPKLPGQKKRQPYIVEGRVSDRFLSLSKEEQTAFKKEQQTDIILYLDKMAKEGKLYKKED